MYGVLVGLYIIPYHINVLYGFLEVGEYEFCHQVTCGVDAVCCSVDGVCCG